MFGKYTGKDHHIVTMNKPADFLERVSYIALMAYNTKYAKFL